MKREKEGDQGKIKIFDSNLLKDSISLWILNLNIPAEFIILNFSIAEDSKILNPTYWWEALEVSNRSQEFLC